jgi:PAS domain S-box-containing protein
MDADPAIGALCQSIVETASEAIIFAGTDGVIRLWNRGAELLFGHSANEAIGQSLDLIIPERLRAAHWEAFDRSLKSGETKYKDRVLTTRSMHKNGDKLYVDLSFGLLRDTAGVPVGAFAIGRDCTARYLSDAAQRSRIKDLEAQLADSAEKP